MLNSEDKIKEIRTMEAIKKGFMNLNGKFALMAKYMGKEIVGDNNDYYSNNTLEDYWYKDSYNYIGSDVIPTMDLDIPGVIDTGKQNLIEPISSRVLGWHLDLLRNGHNLQINLIFDGGDYSDIEVFYEGKTVYKEINGDLQSYYADDSWEKIIETYYKFVPEKLKVVKLKQKEQSAKNKDTIIKKVMNYLQDKWNLQ